MSRTDDFGSTRSRRPRRPLRLWLGLALAGIASTAFALFAGTRGPGGMGWRGHGFGPGGHHVESLADARDHGAAAAQHLLDEIEADDEQRVRVLAIVEAAVDEVYGLADDHRAHTEALHAALGGTRVDRTELERIRSAEIELADVASRQLVAAIADIAEVLTPQQRERLLDEMEAHHH